MDSWIRSLVGSDFTLFPLLFSLIDDVADNDLSEYLAKSYREKVCQAIVVL